ncbi:MAG: DUF2779 domain-containing protein [Candidatus Pacebacteria bacterium]|nr:DUF2779 domain-containing protein [Candidatus Paceibacterota bacterium]
MKLTKTDFKKYLICPECLWLEKKKPEEFKGGEITDFLKKLIKDGYEVEDKVQEIFPSGVFLDDKEDEVLIQKTKEELKNKGTIFQATFKSERGLFLKVDVFKFNEKTKKWDLYEVKSSSEIKTDLQHNHIKDIAFQKITVEECGLEVGNSYIVHLNRDYIRKGDLDLSKLFVFEEVSEKIDEVREEVKLQIESALELLKRDAINTSFCSCLYKSAGQRCDCFSYFNPQVPEYSTAHILRGKKLQELIEDNIFDPKDIPEDFELTDPQRIKVQLQKIGRPIIDVIDIQETIGKLQYPLYFLDYETLLKPIPVLDGYNPNSQLVFQYSLHIMQKDGTLEHFEYLAKDLENSTLGLVKSLKENIGKVGSVLVWYEPFEKTRNIELGKLHPEYAEFFKDINNRVYDLMKIFKKDYLMPEFKGSASIKKVLPVLVPELSYKSLNVQDGTMAMSAWEEMLNTNDKEKIIQLRKDLLTYCELDTKAMVEIFKVVNSL